MENFSIEIKSPIKGSSGDYRAENYNTRRINLMCLTTRLGTEERVNELEDR